MISVDEQACARVVAPRRVTWLAAGGLAAGYVVFGLAVHLRVLDSFDVAVRHRARPGGWWGPEQIEASRAVSALTPLRFALLLLLVVVAVSLARSSLRPLGLAGLVGGFAIAATVSTKWVMAHADTGRTPVAHDAFPSGHVVSATMGVGLAVLLLRPAPRWSWSLAVLAGAVVGTALVFADVHPATDVLGGGLLAGATLTAAAAAGLGPWAAGRGRDPES